MNWYRDNRWLGNFLISFTASLLLAICFLFRARSGFIEASLQLHEVASERARLEHLNPFPNQENFRKTQAILENYGATLNKTKDDLKRQVVPLVPLAPNEFQSQLRQAIVTATDRARANRVKLPENFHLGFDEFTATLPDPVASPLFGQQLNQMELLLNILIDNRVDAVTDLKRLISPADPVAIASSTTPKSSIKFPKIVERSVIKVAFTASPIALRKVLNQIAIFDQQFMIVRILHVWNEQPNGPPREQTGGASAASISPGPIKFIVGNEHLQTVATVELLRFTFNP